jgi:hypothetical protein
MSNFFRIGTLAASEDELKFFRSQDNEKASIDRRLILAPFDPDKVRHALHHADVSSQEVYRTSMIFFSAQKKP